MSKTVLLILFCGFSSLSFAQVFKPDIKKLADKAAAQNFQKQNKPLVFKARLRQPIVTSTSIKREPGVYALPIDNMPCVVPDTKDIAAMPNALSHFPSLLAGRMPNKGSKNAIPIVPKNLSK